MRILFVSDTYYPHLNGVYYFVCRIAPLLQRNGHTVAVLAPSETIHFTRKLIDEIEVYGVPSLPVVLYPKVRVPIRFLLRSRIRVLLDEFVPDVIHIQDHFLLGRTMVKANKRKAIPIMGTNHFMPENLTALVPTQRWKKRLERLLWSRFASVYDQLMLVTTPTETAAGLIRPLLKTEVVAVSSGIDLKKFEPRQDSARIRARYGIPDKRVLLFVGRLDPEKKLNEVLDAVAIALQQTEFCLVVVGKGIQQPALEKRAAALRIADNVIFTGFVPEEDLPLVYHLSQCFIIASIAELLSLATLQAMASSLPVIAARAGALEELVHDQSNGLLFNVGNIDQMANCIVEAMGNEALCREMGAKSLEYSRYHDIHGSVRAFESIYEYIGQQGFWEIVDDPGILALSSSLRK
ncbi:MAG TPA: glycosyltransferase [Puia sp.]|jgi:glycosyltransferase involved in cell wall biosynthesis|nr:glycosyltransferase [Puia sp.]